MTPEADSYSKAEWIAISWTPRLSGLLSIIGSSLIILIIFRGGKERLARIHNRFLLGMSFADILGSLAWLPNTAFMPSEISDYVYGAIGNDATCTVQAAFITIGFSLQLYNGMLCLYYLAVIKHNVKDEVLAKYEPYMHCFALLPTLIIVIFGVSFDIFHPTRKGICWIANGCEYMDPSTCQPRPKLLIKLLGFISISFLGIAFILITFSMGSIYLSVREQARKMRRYQSFSRRDSMNGGEDNKGTSDETFVQACLYVGAYLACFSWAIIVVVTDTTLHIALILLCNFFIPLQGFFNFIIYTRPRFVLVKEKHKDASFFFILKSVVFGSSKEDEEAAKKKKRERRISSWKHITKEPKKTNQSDENHAGQRGTTEEENMERGKLRERRLTYDDNMQRRNSLEESKHSIQEDDDSTPDLPISPKMIEQLDRQRFKNKQPETSLMAKDDDDIDKQVNPSSPPLILERPKERQRFKRRGSLTALMAQDILENMPDSPPNIGRMSRRSSLPTTLGLANITPFEKEERNDETSSL